MSVLWTAAEAAKATGGRTPCDWQAKGVSIDTRTIEPGDLFVALTDQRDGHDFVAQALDNGAAAALVSRVPDGVAADAPLLIVDDVLQGLEALGRAARVRTTAKVVGITGSVGKTGTKDMLRHVLSQQGRTHAAVKSFNNHWGVPLTLARMPRDTEFAVIEIGMNAPGEIAPLARMADLDVAMITTVAAVHAGAFENEAGIAREKAAIFEGLRAGGTAVVQSDFETHDVVMVALPDGVRHFGFGQKDQDNELSKVELIADRTIVQARLGGDEIHFKLGAPGRHLAMNALGVLAVVRALGADVPRAMLALANWRVPDGRGARHIVRLGPEEGETLDLIDEAYNANPTSMGAALEVLAASAPRDGVGRTRLGRRIACLGDMLELGPQSAALHGRLAEHPAMAQVDLVFTCGSDMAALHSQLPPDKRGDHFDGSAQLAAQIVHALDAGDVVMAKGSLGSRMSRVVDAILAMDRGEG